MANCSSIFAWRIPWTEEPGGLQSLGWSDWAHTHAKQSLEATDLNVRDHIFGLSPTDLYITDIPAIITELKCNVCSLISSYEWWRAGAQESENLGWNPTWLPSTMKLDILLKSSGPQLLHLLNGSNYSPYQDCCEDKRNEYIFSAWNSSWHILSSLKYHLLQEKDQRIKQANTL